MSRRTITDDGAMLLCRGGDGDPSSSTVGLTVIRWKRPTTVGEREINQELLAKIRAEIGKPAVESRYRERHDERDAWIRSLPRAGEPR